MNRHFHLTLLTALCAFAPVAGNAAPSGAAPSETAAALRDSCLGLSEKNEMTAAIADCDRAIALEPGNSIGYYTRGKILLFANHLDRAIADFDRTLAMKPKSAGAFTLRGMAYYRKGDYDHAIADYKEAIRLWPDVRWAKSLLVDAEKAKAVRAAKQKTRKTSPPH